MTGTNPNRDLSMHIQNLVKFYHFVLKILSRNEIVMDRWIDGQPKSSTAPLFQSGAIIMHGSNYFARTPTPPPPNTGESKGQNSTLQIWSCCIKGMTHAATW